MRAEVSSAVTKLNLLSREECEYLSPLILKGERPKYVLHLFG